VESREHGGGCRGAHAVEMRDERFRRELDLGTLGPGARQECLDFG
jgi:hypothetical protein